MHEEVRVSVTREQQVVHTFADPPNHGRICFAVTGWTRNSRNADRKIVAA
jgi:hypothetical protein